MEDLWERLVHAALRGRVTGGDFQRRPEAGLAANVPSSLGNKDIDDILRAADEIQDDDPNVSRICTCTLLVFFVIPLLHIFFFHGLIFLMLAKYVNIILFLELVFA